MSTIRRMSNAVSASKRPQIFWDVPGNNFACLECVGHIEVPVKMLPCNKKAKVFYETRDGTAKKDSEYKAVSGYLEFHPSPTEQTQFVKVEIIDDEEAEEDVDFYIDLFGENNDGSVDIFGPTCVITVIDDDDPGILAWKEEQIAASGFSVELVATRRQGASGKQTVKVVAEETSAKE